MPFCLNIWQLVALPYTRYIESHCKNTVLTENFPPLAPVFLSSPVGALAFWSERRGMEVRVRHPTGVQNYSQNWVCRYTLFSQQCLLLFYFYICIPLGEACTQMPLKAFSTVT